VKPANRQNPGPIAPITRPLIVTDALETRWSRTLMILGFSYFGSPASSRGTLLFCLYLSVGIDI
jgi:hypothetical protein